MDTARSFTNRAAILCLRALLKPVARYCLQNSIRIQELYDYAKAALIEAATQEIKNSGHKVTDSRLSIMTGLHRRDITRLAGASPELSRSASLISRVLAKWQTDKNLNTKAGEPRTLSIDGEQSDFAKLVRSISSELPANALLIELERIEAVEHTRGGIKLRLRSYVPKGDLEQGFAILSDDTEHLIQATSENVLTSPEIPNLHLRTEYDRIRPQALPEIRRWLLEQGAALHKRAREFLAQHDQDLNPDPNFKGHGKKVVIGSFSRIIE